MQAQTKQLWLQLCEQAANEQNPQRFRAIVGEIGAVLELKTRRLRQSSPQLASNASGLIRCSLCQLHRYEVLFYAKMPDERLIYVVFYEYDPATEHGYVYFPGRTEEWYRLNVSSIFHGVEGKWFPAWSVWEGVARPLIAGAKAEAHVK